MNDFILKPAFDLPPQVADYFGLWCVYDEPFRRIVDQYQGLNLPAHLNGKGPTDAKQAQSDRDYPLTPDGIAVISIIGPTMKYASSLGGGASTVQARQQLRQARKSADVAGAMLVMDTPGGTQKGNEEFAEEVARFAEAKPIYGFVDDMTASAGVAVMSQTTRRFANNATAMYGAMGTYSVLVDYSGEAEALGIQVHVIKAGEFKGMGEPGTKITEAQLAEAQRLVNTINDAYLEQISRGTGLPLADIRDLADGRVIMASDAVDDGLLHGVQTLEQTYEQLVAATRKNKTTPLFGRQKMDAATLKQLKEAFPNSTADWREKQIENEATLEQASVDYAKHVDAQLKAKEEAHAKELDELKAKQKEELEKAQGEKRINSGSLGHDPLGGALGGTDAGDLQSGDPIEDFNALVSKAVGPQRDGVTALKRRQSAIARIASTHPELYKNYLVATGGDTAKKRRQIEEKLEAIGGK